MSEVISAAGYIRVSTAEQALKGLSIETQMAEIESYAKAHNMKLVGFYIDRGITARKSLHKRTDFMRMMGDVETGKIQHIVVLRLDRFFRNIYDYHRMMNEYLTPNGCDWSAVKENYTTTTTNGRLMINLRLSIAEQECDTDSDRIKDVFENRVKNGFVITGAVQMGLKIENKRLVPDEETAHIIVDVFNEFEKCNSVRKTMEIINNRYNLQIRYPRINKMLKNTRYCGEFRGMLDYCEPIVSREQFYNVQRLLTMNVKAKRVKRTYLFSSLLKCGNCNHSLAGATTTHKGIEYKNYRCNLKYRDKECNHGATITEKNLETYLLDHIEMLLKDVVATVEKMEEKKKPTKSNRKAVEQKLKRLNDLYVDGFIDIDKYKADYERLKNSIIDDEDNKARDLTEIKKFLNSGFKAIYPTLSDDEKQALWRGIIKDIIIDGKEVRAVNFL
jgi:DNA invertase Pin-like site-specific DNA recombinase